MPKIKLGSQPKTIPHDLSFPMLDGTTGEIKVQYTYRTRKAFATFVDANFAVIRAAAEKAIEEKKAQIEAAKDAPADSEAAEAVKVPISEAELAEKQMDSQVNFIMGAVEGWNLDIPFDREAVQELVDELPQAAVAIIQSYRVAMTEGRLGN